jgi:hypothetical protein
LQLDSLALFAGWWISLQAKKAHALGHPFISSQFWGTLAQSGVVVLWAVVATSEHPKTFLVIILGIVGVHFRNIAPNPRQKSWL